MSTIPIGPYPNQNLTVLLSEQKCQIDIKQKSTGVFVNVTIDDMLMIQGQIALDRVPILFADYRGFVGTLQFEDNQGIDNPDYLGFGDRWTLNYYS